MAVYRVGIDIGGTFTDFVLVDEETGAMRFAKELTTPRDPSAAVLTGAQPVVGVTRALDDPGSVRDQMIMQASCDWEFEETRLLMRTRRRVPTGTP